MRRGWKILWSVIAICAVVGVIFCVASLVMGLTFSELKAAYPNGIGIVTDNDKDRDISYLQSEETMEVFDNVRELEMEVGGCDVEILCSEDDKVRVDTSELIFGDSGMKVESSMENGKLTINMEKEGSVFNIFSILDGKWSESNVLYVYLPADVRLERTELNFGAADVYVENMNTEQLMIKAGAADCDIDNLEAGEMEIEVGAGDLELSGNASGNISIDCGAGDIELELKGSKFDYNYAVKCGAGGVDIDGMEFEGLAYTKRIDNGSSKEIKIDCGAGDVSIYYY